MANPDILEAALAIRSSRAMDNYLGRIRMAHEQMGKDTIEESRALRDETVDVVKQMLQQQQAILESHEELIAQVVELTAVLAERLIKPVVINMPSQRVTLEQQPVTVNLPKPSVQVNPVINPVVKGPDVIIPEKTLPKRLTIRHSDGTKSTIEFTK